MNPKIRMTSFRLLDMLLRSRNEKKNKEKVVKDGWNKNLKKLLHSQQ